MRYFTPERFVQLQDLANRDALAAWDGAGRRYAVYLQTVQDRLPRSLKQFVQRCPLHDATVVSISERVSTLVIVVQPEDRRDDLLSLTYALIAPPRINRDALPVEYRTEHVEWLHDELTLARPIAVRNGTRKLSRPTYAHDILLSNGWELHVRFWRLTLGHAAALLPSPHPFAGHREEVVDQPA